MAYKEFVTPKFDILSTSHIYSNFSKCTVVNLRYNTNRLSAFVYRLFHEDFSPTDEWREIYMKQFANKCRDKLTSVIFVHKALQ